MALPLPQQAQPDALDPGGPESFDLVLARLHDMWDGLLSSLPRITVALLVLLATWLAAWLISHAVRKVSRRRRLRRSLSDLFSQLVTVLVWVIGLLVAANVVFPSLTPGKTLAALGLGSIAIGFAFKDIFENFFAGILILWRFPFENGDFIECGGIEGAVEETTIRNTMIRRTDGELIVVPNAKLFKEPVRVLTSRKIRRTSIVCGVAYGEDVDRSRTVIERAVRELGSVEGTQPVQVFAQAFNSSSIDFEVAWWTGARPVDIRRSRDEVVAAIKRSLDREGIEIPFPYRTLTFKQPLRIDERSGADDRADP